MQSTAQRGVSARRNMALLLPFALVAFGSQRPERAALLTTDQASREPAEQAQPRARIHGRVLDERGLPIAGARISLGARDGAWLEGLAVPFVEQAGELRPGFEARSAGDGFFSLSVPTPDSSRIELHVEACADRASERRVFGGARSGATELLVTGDNPLGKLVLRDAGWIHGRVVDEHGEPVAGAELALDEAELPLVLAQSNSEGRYSFFSIAQGGHFVRAERAGRGLRFDMVQVRANHAVTLDFELAPLESASGIVVDPTGRPLSGVTLYAQYTSTCFISHLVPTKTRADGRFVVQCLGAIEALGFEPTVNRLELGRRSREAFDDVRLVLASPTRISLRVLDARDGSAIREHGARTFTFDDARSGGASAHLPLTHAPDGVSQLHVDPARTVLQCAAPGYSPFEWAVPYDGPERTSATVHLHPGARIRGRWPGVAHPSVRLVGLGSPRTGLYPDGPPTEPIPLRLSHCVHSPFLGRPRTRVGEADGSFEFDSLAAGWYELRAQAEGESPRVIESFWLGGGELLDLGDLLGTSAVGESR